MATHINRRPDKKISKAIPGREEKRGRILTAALKLLNEGGSDAVTTRAVSEAAGVQPPVLYRLFTDKTGLLDALAEHGFALYIARKQAKDAPQDSVEALRSGWDKHIQFGLDHPSLYLLMYAQPHAGTASAAELSFAMLKQHVGYVAAAGRLRVPEEQAVALFHSAALGVVLTLLRSPRPSRDLALSTMARENILSMIAITEDVSSNWSPIAAAATTLDAAITLADGFSHGEFELFKEWLGRIKRDVAPTSQRPEDRLSQVPATASPSLP